MFPFSVTKYVTILTLLVWNASKKKSASKANLKRGRHDQLVKFTIKTIKFLLSQSVRVLVPLKFTGNLKPNNFVFSFQLSLSKFS